MTITLDRAPAAALTEALHEIPRPRLGDRPRRAFVAKAFASTFGRLENQLCDPGGLPTHGIHRVLVCRPNHRLGNTVLISPLIAEIEALYPGAQIDLVGSEAAASLYSPRFSVHRLFVLSRRIARHPVASAGLLRDLRSERYDLAIDPCDGSQSGRLVLALAKARFKIGFPDRLANPFSAWHRRVWPQHLAHRGVFLLRTAYAGTTSPGYPPLDMGLSLHERTEASAVLARLRGSPCGTGHGLVGIFTNATGAKRFGQAWWNEFIPTFERLAPGVQLVDLVAAHGRSDLAGRFPSFYTQNIRRLGALIAGLDGFISADCGVMHLAAASGTPTLGLFSTTDPGKYAPYGEHHGFVRTREMDVAGVASKAAAWFASARSSRAACAAESRVDP
ncbi:glycosyltransferase family 9 protein [Rhodanobacter denitrificans]|uniref:glycosyltransferase family 9 protein n=1 Tax=Rhodanobacteraceae TaxID=1775411 RepID=UPI000260D500|nr:MULTISPECIES: glycosyltransferase family 9 protein [Rhodanobacteraceae]EIM04321.1 glycosyl transferase family protein [Rhodanobacter denitrificans]MCX7515259.1 glycosyltransferase family 9 protein [Frateuria sp. STR12]UJM89028.1 glycosyltransferase family 9 protein [Rhodanobacter denitrificans]